VTAPIAVPPPHRLSVRRCAATGAIVLGILFSLCWMVSAISWLTASHMFVAIFTTAPILSIAASGLGLLWSLVSGAITGALVALAYNAIPRLLR
jgi:hypothetical protein